MRDTILIISIISVNINAEAYALSLTSAMGELIWKKIASGSVAVGCDSEVGM
jgi:hypothetical protein